MKQKLISCILTEIILLSMTLCISCDSSKGDLKSAVPKSIGYVLKPDQGEFLLDSAMIVKVSPEMGSESNMTVVQIIKPGRGTGLHYHQDADEIFYIMEGKGTATLGDKSYVIEAGDFVFIPKNVDHKIQKKDSTGILKVLFFLDKPGLLKSFRDAHQQFSVDKKPFSLEALNAIAEKHGTHFKTID